MPEKSIREKFAFIISVVVILLYFISVWVLIVKGNLNEALYFANSFSWMLVTIVLYWFGHHMKKV